MDIQDSSRGMLAVPGAGNKYKPDVRIYPTMFALVPSQVSTQFIPDSVLLRIHAPPPGVPTDMHVCLSVSFLLRIFTIQNTGQYCLKRIFR
jgi:hypothetical protein